jgi:hypothetical protein
MHGPLNVKIVLSQFGGDSYSVIDYTRVVYQLASHGYIDSKIPQL